MKKSIIIIALITGVILGVILHAPLISLFNGTRQIKDIRNAPTPKGFLISPAEACFICSEEIAGIISTGPVSVFADSENYYVVAPPRFARLDQLEVKWSYYAELYGHCVNGRTGMIKTYSGWRNVGFLLMTLEELRQKIPVGTSWEFVITTIGDGYGRYKDKTLESDIYFLQKEGECQIIFENRAVKSIEKLNLGRM